MCLLGTTGIKQERQGRGERRGRGKSSLQWPAFRQGWGWCCGCGRGHAPFAGTDAAPALQPRWDSCSSGSLAGCGWQWDTRGQGITPAIPAHSHGASLGRASLFSAPGIVLGESLRCRWPPGTSIPRGPVPIHCPTGGSRAPGPLVIACFISASPSLPGEDPALGTEGTFPSPSSRAGDSTVVLGTFLSASFLCHQLSVPPCQGYLGEERAAGDGRVFASPSPIITPPPPPQFPPPGQPRQRSHLCAPPSQPTLSVIVGNTYKHTHAFT